MRSKLIARAGIVIVLLAAGAFFVPAANGWDDSTVIGSLLIAAGVVEALAGRMRRQVKAYAVAAGAITALAGLIFLLRPSTHLFPNVVLVISWLCARAALLAVSSRYAGGSVRRWTLLSAGMDFVLAVLLTAGLSVSTIIIAIFGPTEGMIASFAWVLAASFVANGLMLLEVAGCERNSPE